MSDQTNSWLLQNVLGTSTITELGFSENMNMELNAKLGKITIDDLINDQSIIIQKEKDDLDRLNIFFSPSLNLLKPALLAWAKKGFPPIEKISEITLNPPNICSDGNVRTFPFYVEYILNDTIANYLNKVNAITVGMTFTYSWVDSTIRLHVTRN